jgi:hypothetical protein
VRATEYRIVDDREYTGEELSSLWIRKEYGLIGDAIVAWRGNCRVLPNEHMLDFEDIEQSSVITSDRMLHFICELFDSNPTMELATTRQRLFAAIVSETLSSLKQNSRSIYRDGDDLFTEYADEEVKLSVSIATISLQSTLFHFGINISTKGTPSAVKCGSLEFLYSANVEGEAAHLAREIMKKFVIELEGISKATLGKVKTV